MVYTDSHSSLTVKSIRVAGFSIVLVLLTSCTSPGSFAAPCLGVVVDSDLRVVDMAGGSVAEQAGVQVGDVLLALNGTTYTTWAEWHENLALIKVGQDYEVTIQRGSETSTLKLTGICNPDTRLGPGGTPTLIPTIEYYLR
jgi:S1-C subfamily serine protease